jgi:hypothetical protein
MSGSKYGTVGAIAVVVALLVIWLWDLKKGK